MAICQQCKTPLREGDRFCSNCGASIPPAKSVTDPMVGRTIAGSYLILEPIGTGGMGRVYKAEQKTLGRTVAIKFMHQHLLSDEQTVARFYTEARAASRLNHPNSVGIIDFGRTDDDILYLVMECLRGKDLASLMNEKGPLPLLRIIDIIISVLSALGEAHALGVIHRDLKPENIFVEHTRMGRDLVKVVDFGLAKLRESGQASPQSLTSPGLVCGTPDYMSPEQGRGEQIDGRGDLYSVGVLLYELLTEKLPYAADTPTKVVLKHIQDPVPDPGETAPQRNIPQHLAEIVMRAMAKKASDRYQKAEEMIEALRASAEAMLSVDEDNTVCPSCGMLSPKRKRFCGECGALLAPSQPSPARRPSARVRLTPPPKGEQTLIGRAEELGRIHALREEVQEKLVSIAITGEPGIGKTRLLAAVAEQATRDGDLVLRAGPHDSGAPVPYWPIRTLLVSLHDTDQDGLWEIAQQSAKEGSSLADAGIREVVDPVGLKGAEGKSRAAAAACALAIGIRVALGREGAERVVLIVDDLDRCDGLTRGVLGQLPRFTEGLSVLLMTSLSSPEPRYVPDGTEMLSLRRLNARQARALMGSISQRGTKTPVPEERPLLPLYIEQIHGLGLSLSGTEEVPSRLADVVGLRLERLQVAARLVLQCASVLGYRCSRNALMQLAGENNMSALDSLREQGLVATDGDSVEIIHPFVRDLIETYIPAEVRRELHAHAFKMSSEQGAPLEVRAGHAYRAGEAFVALMLLEQMGNAATQRGDFDTAILAYQRGLESARRELLETGDLMLDAAIATFSHKLGVAMARMGDAIGAEGVLREALGLTEPVSRQRARMLVALAKMVAARKRFPDASRLLNQSLEIARELDNEAAQAEVYLGIAEVKNDQEDKPGAAEALQTACELLAEADANALERASTEAALAADLLAIGELQKARERLEIAERWAREAECPYLLARVSVMLAQLEARVGEHKQTLDYYHRAIRFAAQAGDADTVQLCEQALSAMGRDSMTAPDLRSVRETQPSDRTLPWDGPPRRSDAPESGSASQTSGSGRDSKSPSDAKTRVSFKPDPHRVGEPPDARNTDKRGNNSRP